RVWPVVLCGRTSQTMAAAGGDAVAPQFWPVWIVDHGPPPGGQDTPGPALHAAPGRGAVWLRDLAVRHPATAISAAGMRRLVIPGGHTAPSALFLVFRGESPRLGRAVGRKSVGRATASDHTRAGRLSRVSRRHAECGSLERDTGAARLGGAGNGSPGDGR